MATPLETSLKTAKAALKKDCHTNTEAPKKEVVQVNL